MSKEAARDSNDDDWTWNASMNASTAFSVLSITFTFILFQFIHLKKVAFVNDDGKVKQKGKNKTDLSSRNKKVRLNLKVQTFRERAY